MEENIDLDLSIPENRIIAARNWEKYGKNVVLPKKLDNRIADCMIDYHIGVIANCERQNIILDVLEIYFGR